MKSSLIDKANRAMKKNRNRLIIGDKRRVENASFHISHHSDYSITKKQNNSYTTKVINLKSNVQKDKIMSKKKKVLEPLKNHQRSQPPKRVYDTFNPVTPSIKHQNHQKLPPRSIKTPQKQTSLPRLQENLKLKKPSFLLSLREENNRIREELKQISKQLSLHINRQMREKMASNVDFEKETKFIDGNLLNSQKRMEIADHEYEIVRAMLIKEGKFGKQLQLKKQIKEIEEQ
jgi:hypothetical protein